MNLNPELITFFAAMIPFLELKLAIPLGRELGLSTTSTFIFALSGALLPPALFLALFKPITEYARTRSRFLDLFFTKLFEKTRNNHTTKIKKYGSLFLIFLIATPLPGSGTITAALIAFIFGIDYWKAFTLIIIGSFISATLLMAGTQSIFALLRMFA